MTYARYLQAITKGLHDTVLPQLDKHPEMGQARDVLTNSLRALSALATNLDAQSPELLSALESSKLPAELASLIPVMNPATADAAIPGLQLPTRDPVDDFAMGTASFPLIEAGARWLASTPWLSSAESLARARTLLNWEHGLRTQAVARITDLEQGRMDGADQATGDVPDITPESLQNYLRRRLENPALEVTSFRFLTGGRLRQTALFTIARHEGLPEKQVIQRDHPAGLTSFKGPAMQFPLLKRLHAAGLKVPQPLLLEEDKSALGGTFMIATQLAGLSPVPAMDYFTPPPKSERLARTLAQQVAMLHTTPVNELAAILSTSLDEQNPSWASDTAKMEALWNGNAHAPSMAMTAAFAWMRAHAGEVEDRRGLVHSDLLLHNILVEGEDASAILDWEAAHIGHPAEDLGYLRPVIEQMTDWQHFLDAYAAAGGRCPSAMEIDFFTLRALTTLSVWVQFARGAFESGRTADFTMAEVGAAFLPKLVNRLGQQIVAILQRT